MRRLFVALLVATSSSAVSAQRSSVWLDASGAHSRPPGGTSVDAANYGLIGARLRFDGRASALELSASYGRGAEAARGSWLSARAGYDISKAVRMFDFGVRADAGGMTYVTPVQLGAGSDYAQSMLSGTVRPQAGVSLAGFRVGIEGTLSGGAWRAEVTESVGGPFPLPGNAGTRTQQADGAIRVAGGAASVVHMFGGTSVELRAGSYDVKNQVTEGRYHGVDASIGFALGDVDVSVGARRWQTPLDTTELGGHAGIGIALGSSAYVQAVATRSVSDPLSGASGSNGLSIGMSVRVGGTGARGTAASVGAATGRGRVVTFRLERAHAGSVAVAGDFSGWEPRALSRGTGDEWTLETVLEPGVYHYSFIIDGTEWHVPEDAAGIVDDGFGRKNATVIVNAENATRQAAR